MNTTLFFTDLDGTLLNHDDYSFDEHCHPLKESGSPQYPLILTTSKTYSETEILPDKNRIDDPLLWKMRQQYFYPHNYTIFLLKNEVSEPPFQVAQTIQLV
jgi:mannosyl-3-phosphoglycerate phosphatase